MSLQPFSLYIVPEQTARVARAAFPKGSLCLRLYDELLHKAYGEFKDEVRQLDEAYSPETVCTDGFKSTRLAWLCCRRGVAFDPGFNCYGPILLLADPI